MRNKLIFILIVFLSFSACKTALYPNLNFDQVMNLRSAQAKALEWQADTVNCHKNTTHQHLTYTILNNLWGESNLNKDTASLCTYSRDNDFGWKWKVPAHAKGVIGYPSVRVGTGPWTASKGGVNGLPIRIDSIQTLKVDYATEIYTQHKTYNLAFDIWLNAVLPASQNNITTEIMVWEDYYDFNTYGKKVDEIVTDFGTYKVMKGYLKDEKFNQDWQYYAFVRENPRQAGQVDFKVFIDYLIQHHALNPTNFATSVEFGNEIGDSNGFTLVKKFDFTLN